MSVVALALVALSLAISSYTLWSQRRSSRALAEAHRLLADPAGR